MRNPEKHREYMRTYLAKNRDKHNLAQKEGRLRRNYGLTIATYQKMLESQGGGCAICGRKPTPERQMPVDHDHGTGKTRGIICIPCNRAIAVLGDNVAGLERALAYLRRAVV